MSIIKWRPFFDIDEMQGMDKVFENFGSFNKGFAPALDVYQTKDAVIVETPIPGVEAENVNISIENDVLTIEGKSEKKKEVDEKDYYLQEVRSGSFHRSVALPAAVEGEKATAQYEKGILKITIPKAEKAIPKTIKVEVKK